MIIARGQTDRKIWLPIACGLPEFDRPRPVPANGRWSTPGCPALTEGSDRKLHSVAVTGTGWPNCHPASFSDLDWVKLCRANDNVGRAIMSMSMSMSRVFAGRIIPGLLAYSSKAPLPVAPPTNASTGAVPPKPTETSRSFRSVAYAGRCRLAHRDSPELLLQLPYAGMTFLIPS